MLPLPENIKYGQAVNIKRKTYHESNKEQMKHMCKQYNDERQGDEACGNIKKAKKNKLFLSVLYRLSLKHPQNKNKDTAQPVLLNSLRQCHDNLSREDFIKL